jgi:hypothetical protein
LPFYAKKGREKCPRFWCSAPRPIPLNTKVSQRINSWPSGKQTLWLMMVNAIHMGYQWLMMVNGDING